MIEWPKTPIIAVNIDIKNALIKFSFLKLSVILFIRPFFRWTFNTIKLSAISPAPSANPNPANRSTTRTPFCAISTGTNTNAISIKMSMDNRCCRASFTVSIPITRPAVTKYGSKTQNLPWSTDRSCRNEHSQIIAAPGIKPTAKVPSKCSAYPFITAGEKHARTYSLSVKIFLPNSLNALKNIDILKGLCLMLKFISFSRRFLSPGEYKPGNSPSSS